MLTYRHLQIWTGVLFFSVGLYGETVIGVWFLLRADLWLLPLHVFAVLIWSFGITVMHKQETQLQGSIFNKYLLVNKWGIAALILGLCTFPGSGSFAYSAALGIATLLHRSMGATSKELERTLGKERGRNELKPLLEVATQPTIDVLQEDAGIETKQFAIVKLSHQGTPEAMQMLRHLLVDPHAEIRTDASVTLTRLEDTLSRSLNSSLQQWIANPADRENTRNLADQYYRYASSNVLDEASQRFYFVKAQDLLQSMVRQDAMDSNSWLKLARIHQRLNEFEEALQAVRVALQLNTYATDAYLLGMELAFSLHDWDALIAIANAGIHTLPETCSNREIAESLQWWAALQAQKQGEAVYV